MLSGETAKGAYPILAVQMMAETCYLAESTICYPPLFNELRSLTQRPTATTETVAMAAVAASLEQNAGAILVMSTSGNTARLISKFRPSCPILTLTRNEVTARQIHLHRGCYPFFYNEPRPTGDEGWQTDVDNRIKFGLKQALDLGIIRKGDTVIAVQGWRSGGNNTNTMRVLAVPENVSHDRTCRAAVATADHGECAAHLTTGVRLRHPTHLVNAHHERTIVKEARLTRGRAFSAVVSRSSTRPVPPNLHNLDSHRCSNKGKDALSMSKRATHSRVLCFEGCEVLPVPAQ